MAVTTRKTRSFSLDSDLLAELDKTKGASSVSERVNQLLKLALEAERKADLSLEAKEFFNDAPDDRQERRAFQKASLKTLTRE